MFERVCSQCKKKLYYSNIKNRNKAEKEKILCKDCVFVNKKYETLIKKHKYNKKRLTVEQVEYIKTIWDNQNAVWQYVKLNIERKKEIALQNKETTAWERNCPKCGRLIIHTVKGNRDKAQKDGVICTKCSHKLFGEQHTGENNPFFGKKHSKESMDKMKETSLESERRKNYIQKIKSNEYRKMMSEKMSGENNPRSGKGSLYEIWLRKYGEEKAKERFKLYTDRVSFSTSGEKSHAFGKVPAHGVGNGWSGWYKGWFFRSIHELSYMINVIEKNNLHWKSAECSNFKISYIDEKGKKSNYFADFIIDEKLMIEVKPQALQRTKNVILKSEAAKEFCENNMMKYEIIEPPKLTDDELMQLYLKKEIKFTNKTEEKFVKKYLKD